jgi:hypothetical protein
MTRLNFFEQNKLNEFKKFQIKLKMALDLIRKNQLLAAQKTSFLFHANAIKIQAIHEVARKQYRMTQAYKLRARRRTRYARAHQAQNHISVHLFEDHEVSFDSQKTPHEIACILIKEVNQYIKKEQAKQERHNALKHNIQYANTMRFFQVERVVERNNNLISRSKDTLNAIRAAQNKYEAPGYRM